MVTGALVRPARTRRLLLALALLLVLAAVALVAAHAVLAGAPTHTPFLQHLRVDNCTGSAAPC
jgi:hypothetical protein